MGQKFSSKIKNVKIKKNKSNIINDTNLDVNTVDISKRKSMGTNNIPTLTIQRTNNQNTHNNIQLICDDNYANRLVIKKFLEIEGYKTDDAIHGAQVIEKINEKGEYSIIWIDLQMPKMDGIKCSEYLRKNMNYKRPIIGITGYVDEISVKKCIDAGMNYVLSKPINREILYMYAKKYSL